MPVLMSEFRPEKEDSSKSVIESVLDQVKGSHYKPKAIYMVHKGKLVDIMKHKKYFRKHFKTNQ